MASRVVMPKLSDTMEEGRIIRWLKQEGDAVETGQALAEVETDKATVEMEAYANGVIRKLVASEGDTIRIGSLIAIIGAPDEDVSSLLAEEPVEKKDEPSPAAAERPAAERMPARKTAPEPRAAKEQEEGDTGRRGVRASPLALRMAAESGLDLSGIQGTGPQGRIIKRDIEGALQGPRPGAPAAADRGRVIAKRPAAEGEPEFERVELSSMRRTIAKRLLQSKAPVPHFYLTVDVAMDRTWEAYRALREEHPGVTINDIVIKATATALRRHPDINASFAGDHVRQYSRVHMGLAVAIDEGLITPVIRDADARSLEEISAEAKQLGERARARKLQPHEYTGATFSISNLGMMGIEEFSAIINPPEAAILAVGMVRQVPVALDGELAVGYRMKLTLSVDHRVADGAQGARFLQTLKRILENPLLMG
jgi:pyruvate dehydrogenase E2 component (dihydrolipoamide acetyltransferase)